MKKTLLALSLLAASLAFGMAAEDGFVPLFNGKDTTGWHLRNPAGQNSWTVDKGVLKNTVAKGEHGTDLVTDQKFKNFTVKYEYLVPDNSNSGFYLRGRHEIQILGDFASGAVSLGGNGALYNFKTADKFMITSNAAKAPAASWTMTWTNPVRFSSKATTARSGFEICRSRN